MNERTIEAPERPPNYFFRFLVVDDEQTARKLLRSILQTREYTNVDEAVSGEEALVKLKETEYHVVLLDKNMPGLDGLEVLKRGKALRPDAEFIMVTAYGSMETAIESMDLGAFSYVTKPFSQVDVILRRVDAALNRALVVRENVILLERLQMLVRELDKAEAEAEALREAASAPRPSGEPELLQRMGQALDRLRKLSVQLSQLRRRSEEGTAANWFEKMEAEVSGVADVLVGPK